MKNIRLKEEEVAAYTDMQYAQNLDIIQKKVKEIVKNK